MPYNYQLSEEAESDIFDSYRWYEKQRVGLGEEFMESLDAAEQAISDNPSAFGIRYKKKVRAYVVDRFPYLVLYAVNWNDIDVIAVFNTNRHSKRWKKRIK